VRNNPGPGGPNWGTVTAEDDPPSPSRCYGGSTGRIFFSIAVPEAGSNEGGRRLVTRVITRSGKVAGNESRLLDFFVTVADASGGLSE